jgi:hypothetical protein
VAIEQYSNQRKGTVTMECSGSAVVDVANTKDGLSHGKDHLHHQNLLGRVESRGIRKSPSIKYNLDLQILGASTGIHHGNPHPHKLIRRSDHLLDIFRVRP